MSGPMVRAILDGRKTQTRRIVKPQPSITTPNDASWRDSKCDLWRNKTQFARDCCPYGAPGDRLWVRETWAAAVHGSYEAITGSLSRGYYHVANPWSFAVQYRAGYLGRNDDYDGAWRTSIHMPRWASRINLEVTGVRVERLQDINETDAISEGIFGKTYEAQYGLPAGSVYYWGSPDKIEGGGFDTAKQCYECLWNQINGTSSWAENPWVWVIDFRRLTDKRP
jgi:lysozyme family protein